jgi:hypothetical protein
MCVASTVVAVCVVAGCGSRVAEDEIAAAYGFDQLENQGGADDLDGGTAVTTADGTPAVPGQPGDPGTAASTGAAEGDSDGGAAGGEDGGGGPAPTEVTESGRVLPEPGRYTLNVTGTSTLNGTAQAVPPTAEFVVEQLDDDRQRHRSPDPQGDTVQTLRVTPTALLLERMDLPAGKSFVPPEPVQYAPIPVTVGALWTWSMRSTDGRTTLDHRSLVSGQESITVAGEQIETFVVETVLTLSGDLRGTISFTSWQSTKYGLVARRHTITDVSLGLFRLTGDTTAELASLTPS